MNKTAIIRQIRLGQKHQQTGRTRHLHGTQELPPPAFLQVVQYSEDPGFYLLYFDSTGHELTDTYHETLEGALEQALWEFGVEPTEWEAVNS